MPEEENIMKRIRIKQVRSAIDRPERQKATLIALGLRKISNTAEHEATPQVMGMVEKVKHLLLIEEI